MDILDPILTIAEKVYALCGEVKANKKRWSRLATRVQALMKVVQTVKAKGLGEKPEMVQRGLQELKYTLETAQEVVKKYTTTTFFSRIRKVYDLAEEFEMLNDRLNDNFQLLSLALQIEQAEKLGCVFEKGRCQKEDEADRKNDREELERLLRAQAKKMDNVQEGVDSVKTEVQDIKSMLKSLTEPNLQLLDTKEIKIENLDFDDPKTPIMKSATHELYKGQYNKFTVAIKRYTYAKNTTPREVRRIFKKEVETMKRFESPNILRMFGICVEGEDGPSPNYLIVMEFCEKGNLPQVLAGKSKLSWGRRARMSLDAAQGLYRLHQSEEKFKVHGCISSSKFLVDDGYRVKLGCFELAKTETSLRGKKMSSNNTVSYCSPQQLESIHDSYNKACEIYSFGIVLWEIATRQIPFKGMSDKDIYAKVCKERFTEPLPEDCPKSLAKLIDACRSYEAFQRPTAGVLVDKLRKVVEELDDE
ncbi:mixed lineage kinase domain-like protein [Conger conger]|uniref:mixed lineage kinase domain-like protein n=1 Tax=Conger conger TaxID=82655 RepID=UPI002A5B08FA|nr:mixed lineage kinase domain-like protein [Conger conger]XP_061078032.1 mixed lineage kinase domain-like protein [Conger conger]